MMIDAGLHRPCAAADHGNLFTGARAHQECFPPTRLHAGVKDHLTRSAPSVVARSPRWQRALGSMAVIQVREGGPEVQQSLERRGGGWVLAGGLLFLMILGMAVLASPVVSLLGDSAHAFAAAMHGMLAFLLLITATIGLHQGYRIYRGELVDLDDVLLPSVVNAVLALFTIAFGNWIYIPYRATGGPREYFLNNAPMIHKIYFEFKEYIALFALPLAVAAAFILLYYQTDLIRRPWLRYAVAALLALMFFCVMIAFGLGAAITKLQAA